MTKYSDLQTIDGPFWSKVEIRGNDDCWPWVASINRYGYGQFSSGHSYSQLKTSKAHRVSWTLRNGPIPSSLHVLHKCDNPLCVNPDHLFLGTPFDNMADKVAKGRQAHLKGTSNGHTKLTEAQVLAIRSDSRPSRPIAAEYGVAYSLISKIKSRRQWAHL